MLVESQTLLSNVTFVVAVNNAARVKPMKNQPRILDLVRDWWKSHPGLHKIKPSNQRVHRSAKYELQADPPWVEDPAFGFQCTCCEVWWIVIRDGAMNWAYFKEDEPMHHVYICTIADPEFFPKLEHTLNTIYHPTR